MNPITHIDIASTFWQRLKGLMHRKSLPAGYALLLTKCPRVHTCFMKIPICIIYLDEHGYVLDTEILKPWRLGKKVPSTCHILETDAAFWEAGKKGQLILKFEEEKNAEPF